METNEISLFSRNAFPERTGIDGAPHVHFFARGIISSLGGGFKIRHLETILVLGFSFHFLSIEMKQSLNMWDAPIVDVPDVDVIDEIPHEFLRPFAQ